MVRAKGAENHRFPALASACRLHITVIAALGVFTFGWLFLGRYPWLLTAVCALDWFLVNLANRVVDLPEDEANLITAAGFVGRHRRLILGFVMGVLVVSLVVVHFLNPAITGLRVAGHLLGVFYNWPLLRGRRRLKELYILKNTASAMGFMITVFGYPLATLCWGGGPHEFPPGITWATVIFSSVFFFLFEVSYEVIYDLRDIKGDALAKVRTFPVVHGVKAAVHIADALTWASVAVLAVGYALNFVPWRIFIMAAAPMMQFALYKRALKRGISAEFCTGITWLGAALLLTYNLWVLAKLPGANL